MNIVLLDTFLKILGITTSLSYAYLKSINYNQIKLYKMIFILLISILISLMFTGLKIHFTNISLSIITLIFYSVFFSLITKQKYNISIILTLISATISYIAFAIASSLILIPFVIFNINESSPILFLMLFIFQFAITCIIFKIKRLKNGFTFIYNKKYTLLINILIFVICLIFITTYLLIGNFESISLKNLFTSFVLFTILIIVIIKQTFNLYQDQKLLHKTLKDYENDLAETKQKLETALAEKQNLIKSNHEFHHRQEALNKKLDDLAKQFSINSSAEFSEEYGNIVERLNTLSDEYISKTKSKISLPKTNIVEVDDMLSYMSSECDKNNIEFTLKIDCDVNYIIDNFISKSELETLLGDLIRNAIIAVNHSSDNNKSIMVIFGIKDDSYELCVFDSGIPFKSETLINLGLSPASTHLDEGGSGIGFVTTFETINHSKASFIITELANQTFTKSLEIKFDNKHEYIIFSDRQEIIESINSCDRNIILQH